MFSWERNRPPPKKPPGVTVNIENTGYASVERCIGKLDYKIVWDHHNCLLFWCDNNVGVDFCLKLKPWQFVNHFPGTFAISKKIDLARNIEKMQKQFPDLYNFHPKSFTLPTQTLDLKRVLTKKRTFIIKPDLGAQGRGIFLVQDAKGVDECHESAIAQEYISPYLINGLKFDLRIYVLLASVDPLRIYIFKEGMARFCTEEYEPPNSKNLKEIYRHLTNYSVNKHNDHFKQNAEIMGSDQSSHKRSMTSVFREIRLAGGDTDALQEEIDRIITLTILSVHPFLQHNYRASFKTEDEKSRCFEILGFDVLIDEDLKPWILEVNHSPSLTCDSEFDQELKDSVITGALKIADIPEDFMETMLKNEKARTLHRIGGGPIVTPRQQKLYSPEREEYIAKTTSWRRLYPPPPTSSLDSIVSRVVYSNDAIPYGQLDETKASCQRKIAIRKQMQEMEERNIPPQKKANKVIVSKVAAPQSQVQSGRPTKSVLLLREAKLAKIREDSKKECMFMISQEYEKYLKSENSKTPRNAFSKSLPRMARPMTIHNKL